MDRLKNEVARLNAAAGPTVAALLISGDATDYADGDNGSLLHDLLRTELLGLPDGFLFATLQDDWRDYISGFELSPERLVIVGEIWAAAKERLGTSGGHTAIVLVRGKHPDYDDVHPELITEDALRVATYGWPNGIEIEILN